MLKWNSSNWPNQRQLERLKAPARTTRTARAQGKVPQPHLTLPELSAFVLSLHCSPGTHLVTQHLFLLQPPSATWRKKGRGRRVGSGVLEHAPFWLATLQSGWHILIPKDWMFLLVLEHAREAFQPPKTMQSAGSLHYQETDTRLFKSHTKALYPSGL